MSKLIDSAILITVFTAVLFALGIANNSGFLSAVGIDSDFISLDAYQLLYRAMIVCLIPVFKFLMPVFTIVIVILLICIGYDIFQPDLSCIKKCLMKKIKPPKNSTTEKITEKIYDSSLNVFLVILMLIGFAYGLVYAEDLGREHGQKVLQKLTSHTYEKHEVVKLDTAKYKGEIYIVACGSNNCAGIDVKTLEVVYFENRLDAGSVVGVVKP